MQNEQTLASIQKSQPLVSFVITYYNLPVQMLCECINSIRALSLDPGGREIIVVDDGSEVSPMNGLMQYGEEIIYVRQKNAGVSVARNTGLQMATGRYVQIVDGDDYLLKIPYEHCLDMVRRDADIDLVLFDFTRVGSHRKNSFSDGGKMSGTDYLRNHNLRGAVWCCLFRRSIRGQLAFTPDICYGEDEEFTPQLLLRAEVVCSTDARAYYYRQRPTSAVHQSDDASKEKRLGDTISVIRHLNQLTDRLPAADKVAMQRRVAQLTMDYLYNTIVLTRSRKVLDERIEELYNEGLFPLPDRDYSAKYRWFRKMTATSFGRSVLLHTLPLLKKER